MKRTALAAVGLGVALVLTGCSSDNDSSTDTSTSASSTWTTPAAPSIDMSRFAALPAAAAPAAPTVDCSYAPAGPAAKDVKAPNGTGVSTEGTVPVALATDAGPIGLTLDRAKAPCTVNSFVSLTEQAYYDGTPCHRISTVPGLGMLQCGDPSGRGSGGPGYQYANEYPTNQFAANDPALNNPVVYPRGTVAMANAGADTNGSQFFLVFEDSLLQPNYTVVGTISDEGLATLDKIAAAGVKGSTSPGDGAPTNPVTIETAKLG
ncbi:peptidylprolyl isomerase [Rhodococcus sp. TAF43]|uniref:peptidylprolyl isomerase n=1 Tax=unclassified Rhodococcus (in: high G+C Gram-positive bacteria) TaxID=192944 RepID=UPI0015841DFA|nr:peptidylprolyl isomerase [Rhodococcus sp. W8901]QKT11356.1 peptidylprolyl isomerase [Rhodococcus sp. W8901]